MVFKTIGGCRLTREEQLYIWTVLELWNRLSEGRREEIRSLIGALSDSPLEGRALFDVLVRQVPPRVASERTGVPLGRLYDLRRAAFERIRIL